MNHRLTNDMASLRIMVSRKKGDGNMDSKVFGHSIAAMRKENNMTQAELAKIIGVTDKAVSRWSVERDSQISIRLNLWQNL